MADDKTTGAIPDAPKAPSTVQPDVPNVPDAPSPVAPPVAPVDSKDGILPDAPKIEPKVYAKFNDTHLDGIVTILEDSGVSPEQADELFAEAITSQDFSKIDFEKLKKSVGDKKLPVVKALIESYQTKVLQEISKGKSIAVEVFGSETELASFQSWVATKEASDTEFAESLKSYRKLLETKDPAAIKLVLNELKGKYVADPNVTTGGTTLLVGDVSTPPAQGLSLAEYGKAVLAAVRNGTYAKVIGTLNKQRAIGSKQGL